MAKLMKIMLSLKCFGAFFHMLLYLDCPGSSEAIEGGNNPGTKPGSPIQLSVSSSKLKGLFKVVIALDCAIIS